MGSISNGPTIPLNLQNPVIEGWPPIEKGGEQGRAPRAYYLQVVRSSGTGGTQKGTEKWKETRWSATGHILVYSLEIKVRLERKDSCRRVSGRKGKVLDFYYLPPNPISPDPGGEKRRRGR